MKNQKNRKLLRTLAIILGDILVISSVYLLSAYATFDLLFNGEYWPIFYYGLIWVLSTIGVYALFGVYRMQTDNFGLFESIKLMAITAGCSLVLYIIMISLQFTSVFSNFPYLNWKSFVLGATVEAFLVVILRFVKRVYLAIRARRKNKENPIRALVIGAGGAAKIVIDDSRSNPESKIKVVLFVDDDPNKIGNTMSGVRILGPISSVAQYVQMYKIEEVIIAIASLSDDRLHQIFAYLRPCDVRIRRLPLLSEMDKVHEMKVMDVDYDDLLGRGGVSVDQVAIGSLLKGKTILITGAGGSIGGALAVAVAECHPKAILLYDFYESGLFDIQEKVKRVLAKYDSESTFVRPFVGTTSNKWVIEAIFAKYKPDIVYHAGSYKQVPLMEDNPIEAIRQNALGTYAITKAAADNGVSKFIYLSSNKVLDIHNIMSATKRFGEMCCEHFGTISKTTFASIRFGNVLASSGSVVPLFAKQIKDGGPVTVTSKDASRYFVTLEEITQLILQSSVYAKGNQIYDVDMGQPVKIVFVAEQMIRQAGYIPYKDIDIKITGLRHGENGSEPPSFDRKKQIATENKRLFLDPNNRDYNVDAGVQALTELIQSAKPHMEIVQGAEDVVLAMDKRPLKEN
ncbi:MAG: UDP-N-acetyl-alpha-D-glucosamine C6 dehydratase [bacterium ADurb.BinA186]|jgi:FlaA1/EpsC-like NDP-sugar epimerase|nr:MAG: UDP-N-acetyl-alpha-D-glucosamine C6 dehydratase [bacterium ADurb.BinA186]